MKKFLFIAVAGISLAGCKKNPVDRLTNPLPDSSVAQSSGVYWIYGDELKTGGGLGLIPGGQNQIIDLSDATEPRSGSRQIRYTWNGQDVFNGDLRTSSHTFAGFSLLVSPDFSQIDLFSAKDLRSAGYTKLVFKVRGALSANTTLRIEGPNDNPSTFTAARTELTASELTSDWRDIALPIPTNSDFSAVKIFMTVSLQYAQPPRTTNPGEGGTIYLDEIRYER